MRVSEYRLTFGQKFRTETHDRFGAAHPDGWVTILARDYDQARLIAVEALGTAWSGLYPAGEVDESLFPLGELLRLNGMESFIGQGKSDG